MGKCHSKTKRPPPEITIELEKTLQQCLNEKDELKQKYEESNRKYEDIKSHLEKTLRTVKLLQTKLKLSEENASSLYRRYAIESDLNKRLKKSPKTLTENSGHDTFTWKSMANTSYDIRERMDDFENRLVHIEWALKDADDSYSNLL